VPGIGHASRRVALPTHLAEGDWSNNRPLISDGVAVNRMTRKPARMLEWRRFCDGKDRFE
jgi:hypothetical protein